MKQKDKAVLDKVLTNALRKWEYRKQNNILLFNCPITQEAIKSLVKPWLLLQSFILFDLIK